MLALGITSTLDAGVDEANLSVYQQMASEHKIPLRIYAMLSATDANLATRLAAGPIDDPQDILDVRSVKIYGDGLWAVAAPLCFPLMTINQVKWGYC